MTSSHPFFNDLEEHYQQISSLHMKQLFADDPLRFEQFSLEAAGLMLDYSKNRITEKTRDALVAFAKRLNLPTQIEDLFSGKPINNTEKRPALHTALRDPSDQPLYVNNRNITQEIKESLALMEYWIEQLQTQQWLGYSGKPIMHIVHMGIGGSHLGPLMASEVLADKHKPPFCHFVSSVDFIELDTVLQTLDPQTTLFIVASKTFSTQETLLIANRARDWLLQSAGNQDISRHFIATTAQKENALKYGIAADLILPLWDWVGGRFSLWSAAIGLPVALQIGMTQFKALLSGAHQMDQHFRTAPLHTNMPVILALLGFWYIHFFKSGVQAVLPYNYRLRSFPRYLQQVDMESNGKHVQKNGHLVDGLTAPILFGEMGTNGQHSFHQLLFQGTHLVPCDFIATTNTTDESQTILLAHCLAQSRGLMLGKSIEEILEELMQEEHNAENIKALAMHKMVLGNQPSNTILMEKLTPETLGALLALYEHKIFVQGMLWNINSFDQWGVELGKKMAQGILSSLTGKEDGDRYDASTQGLLAYISRNRNP